MTETGNFTIPVKGETYNQVFFQPFLEDKEMFDAFFLISDMRATEKRQMLKLGNFSRKTRRASGCGFNPVGSASMSERWIETVGTEIPAEMCWDELKYGALAAQLGTGNNYDRIENTAIAQAVAVKIAQGAVQDVKELAWFGDTASSDPFFGVVDGIWKYIGTGVTNNEIVALNDKSNVVLGVGEALELMQKIYRNASKELRGTAVGDKIFFVSPDVFYQFREDIQARATGSNAYSMSVVDGVEIGRFNGIEVRCMESWGELGESQFGLDVAQNLIIYTAKQNFVMASDGTGLNANVMMDWQNFERKLRYRIARPLGFNYVHPELIAIHR